MPAAPAPTPTSIQAWWAAHSADLSDPAAAAVAFTAAVDDGLGALPLPGRGQTWSRWQALAAFGAADLTLARLLEAHTDAVAILAELAGPPAPADSRWGVWAAEPPGVRLDAVPDGDGWRLRGTKAWCSGAGTVTHALVTAAAPDGSRLFAVEIRPGRTTADASGWQAVGMAGSDTATVTFDCVPAAPVGGPGDYVGRTGFWHGGIGVAACWWGGAVGIGSTLLAGLRRRPQDPHAAAHLGAVDVALSATRAAFAAAAREIDHDPHGEAAVARRRALRLRGLVEQAATEVVRRTGRALGPAPLCTDRGHARRVADLEVYLRQDHAERDLAALAADLLDADPAW